MGWFWGNSSNNNDPTKKLDPALRHYLEQETPAKYSTTTSIHPSEKPLEVNTSLPQSTAPPSTSTADSSKPHVPSASLFPDGRYAHLWKTYKPLHEIEGSELRTAERVIEKVKQRKETVHKAAMENCSLEHEGLMTCFQKGDLWSTVRARATICVDENRRFSKCYTTQAKFLQALGYAASFEWDEEKEEKIQMHADKLYHQMLDYERQVEEARTAGMEPPPITSLFNPDAKSIPSRLDLNSRPGELIIPGNEKLPPGMKASKPLEDLTPHERELEIRSIKAQIEQQKIFTEAASPFIKSQEDARQKRQERAVRWFGETVGKWIT